MLNNYIETKKDIFYKFNESGKFSFISRDVELLNQVTDRKNVLLKIFFNHVETEADILDYNWGYDFGVDIEGTKRLESSPLYEAVMIQNLCAYHDLAPKVFDIGILRYKERLYPFLLVEDCGVNVENDYMKRVEIFDRIASMGKYYGFETNFRDLSIESNIINGKLVDFQGFRFVSDYPSQMMKRVENACTWKGNVYQNLTLRHSLKGYRSDKRYKLLKKAIDDHILDFKQKVVADIGFSAGEFIDFALVAGASRVKAYDIPVVTRAGMERLNYLAIFDVDYFPVDLKVDKINLKDVDIAFFLSMNAHVGLLPNLYKIPVIIYEHNGEMSVDDVVATFVNNGYVPFDFGVSGDHDDRKLFIFVK